MTEADPRYGRRRLSLMEDSGEQVYRLYQGEELLLERRATPEVIEQVRRTIEPLRPGFHATLGAGKATDPVVAMGQLETQDPASAAAAIAIANARAISELTLDMSRKAVQMFAFTKAVVEEATAAIRTAGAEERASFQKMLAAQAEANGRPLIDSNGVVQILGNIGEVIRQVKGPSNG